MKRKATAPQVPRRPPKKAPVEVLPAERDLSRSKFTPEQVIQAIKTARGMVTAAAEVLQCDRNTVYSYRDRFPEVAAALDKANELQLDTAELNLFKCIDRSEPWAICFYLKTKGRKRGYVERHEVVGPMSMEDLVKLITEDAVPVPAPKLING